MCGRVKRPASATATSTSYAPGSAGTGSTDLAPLPRPFESYDAGSIWGIANFTYLPLPRSGRAATEEIFLRYNRKVVGGH